MFKERTQVERNGLLGINNGSCSVRKAYKEVSVRSYKTCGYLQHMVQGEKGVGVTAGGADRDRQKGPL